MSQDQNTSNNYTERDFALYMSDEEQYEVLSSTVNWALESYDTVNRHSQEKCDESVAFPASNDYFESPNYERAIMWRNVPGKFSEAVQSGDHESYLQDMKSGSYYIYREANRNGPEFANLAENGIALCFDNRIQNNDVPVFYNADEGVISIKPPGAHTGLTDVKTIFAVEAMIENLHAEGTAESKYVHYTNSYNEGKFWVNPISTDKLKGLSHAQPSPQDAGQENSSQNSPKEENVPDSQSSEADISSNGSTRTSDGTSIAAQLSTEGQKRYESVLPASSKADFSGAQRGTSDTPEMQAKSAMDINQQGMEMEFQPAG